MDLCGIENTLESKLCGDMLISQRLSEITTCLDNKDYDLVCFSDKEVLARSIEKLFENKDIVDRTINVYSGNISYMPTPKATGNFIFLTLNVRTVNHTKNLIYVCREGLV